MSARPFVLGLAAGTAVALVIGSLLSNPTTAPEPMREPVAGEDAGAAGRGQDIDRVRMQREIDRLREELERARAGIASARTPAEAVPAAAEPGTGTPTDAVVDRSVEVQPGERDPRFEELLVELDRLLQSGALKEMFGENFDQLYGFLLNTWMEAGRPAEALALLRRFPPDSDWSGYATYIASELRERGDLAGAREASMIALRSGAQDWDLIEQLANLDPAEAARTLASLPTEGIDAATRSAQQAILQLAAGDREAALQSIDALIRNGQMPEYAWQQLVQRDPAAAEARLRTAIDAGGAGSDVDALRLQLAESMRSQGRGEDAVGALTVALTNNPLNPAAIDMLGQIDRGRALRHLEALTRSQPSALAWGMYGDQLLAQNRQAEAVQAFWQATDADPHSGYTYRLLNLAPLEAAPRLVPIAERTRDDELYGDIADALWRAGQRGDAQRYWQRAHDIDQTDGEWIGKLAAVAEGRDPL
ncbi:MAG: hypothetical protein IPM29_13925 [Planctomycetes bacterium]|nr:hypothetical protein [Planctomycetota bacterium]